MALPERVLELVGQYQIVQDTHLSAGSARLSSTARLALAAHPAASVDFRVLASRRRTTALDRVLCTCPSGHVFLTNYKQPPVLWGLLDFGHGTLAALLQWDNEPKDQVGNQAWQPAGQEQDEEQKPEPERSETKELPQAATYSTDPPVASRTS
jgi:hypothetical protein